MSVLRAESLAKVYRKRRVVDDVSLRVESGEVVGLLGPNGAGKTTCFYMVVGLVGSDQGRVLFDEFDLTDLPMHARARMGIGYLPQEPSVFRKLTVADNILAILQTRRDLPPEKHHEVMEDLLREFHVEHLADHRGMSLSGGERRRVEIARSLAAEPRFILLDEPFAGVDPVAVEDIQRIVAQLKNKNIGILITDHNVQETLAITDKTYLMFEGGILKAGIPEELAADEMVRKVYLGQNFELRKKKLEF